MEKDAPTPASTAPATVAHYLLTGLTAALVGAFFLVDYRINSFRSDVGRGLFFSSDVATAAKQEAPAATAPLPPPLLKFEAPAETAPVPPPLLNYFVYMPPSEPVPDSCMGELLCKAEETYQRNMARRGNLSLGSTVSRADLLNRILVPPYPCVLEQRVGKGGEGGKYICRGYMGASRLEAQGPSVVSIGSHGQTSFEEDVNTLLGGAVTVTFDPTMEPFDAEDLRLISFLRFEDKGLMGSAEIQEATRNREKGWEKNVPIQQLLSIVGKPSVDIFKIDCEGCEYGVFRDLEELTRANTALLQEPLLGQVPVEVHFAERNASGALLPLLTRFEAMGYRMFHAEENAYWRWEGFELAFIHNSLVQPPPQARVLSEQESKKCTDLVSRRAAAIYEANWRRKGWRFQQGEFPLTMDSRALMSIMLVSDFPCAQQERFGVWGVGGVWVCLHYREACRVQHNVTVLTVTGQSMTPESAQQSLGFSKDLVSHLGGAAHFLAPPDVQLSSGLLAVAGAGKGSIVLHNATSTSEQTARASLREIMSVVDNAPVFLLRINCGGCEHELVKEMLETFDRSTVPFGQIALSLHNWQNAMPLLLALHSLGYRQFHTEGIGENPSAFELAFLHEKCS